MDKPAHYEGPADALDLMAGMGVSTLRGFCEGNVLKYVFRSGRKSREPVATDLKKAAFYLKLLRAIDWWQSHDDDEVGVVLPRPSALLRLFEEQGEDV